MSPIKQRLILTSFFWLGFSSLWLTGCLRTADNEVIVYAALDKEFSEPILNDLAAEMQLSILTKFDQESNKTVGLVTDLLQNQRHPRADVFWNNEILHTLRLQKLGLLEVHLSPLASQFPAQFISDQQTWHGFAARARVLIINTRLIPDPTAYPRSIYDLADPKWKGRCAMAKPLFGTTATQAAVLFEHLGNAAAEKLFSEIAHNAVIEGGNKTVALKVARGEYAFGITDTDDAIIELEDAQPVAIVFPDQREDQLGTLLIPNTLCIIKNGPNTERAKRLVDRLLQPDVETRLARGPSAQIPLNSSITFRSRVQPTEHTELKIMSVDFSAAADHWDQVAHRLLQIFP